MKKLPVILYCLFLVLVVLVPISPYYQAIPNVDSGVYAYIGDSILKGDVPYTDVWDHKGPLVYYLNAAGRMLTQDTMWGVWSVEVVSLLVTLLLWIYGLQQVFGRTIAWVSAAAWIFSLTLVIYFGNMTEEYTLLFQVLTLYLLLRMQSRGQHDVNYFLIGVCAGLTFTLRPNNIGIFLALGLWLTINSLRERAWRRYLRLLALIASGAGVVFLLFGVFIYSQGSLSEMLDAMFRYNFLYVRVDPEWTYPRLLVALRGIVLFPGLILIGLFVLGSGLRAYLREKRAGSRIEPSILWFALIWLLVEIVFSTLSGRLYDHYLIPWLPPLGLTMALFLDWANQKAENIRLSRGETPRQVLLAKALFGLIIAVVVIPPALPSLDDGYTFFQAWLEHKTFPKESVLMTPQGLESIDLLRHFGGEDRPLLVWGNLVSLNIVTGRPSVGKYVYQEPLFLEDYTNDEIVKQFIAVLEETKPVIVDTRVGLEGNVPSIDSSDWEDSPQAAQQIQAYFQAHYELTDITLVEDWVIYQYVEDCP